MSGADTKRTGEIEDDTDTENEPKELVVETRQKLEDAMSQRTNANPEDIFRLMKLQEQWRGELKRQKKECADKIKHIESEIMKKYEEEIKPMEEELGILRSTDRIGRETLSSYDNACNSKNPQKCAGNIKKLKETISLLEKVNANSAHKNNENQKLKEANKNKDDGNNEETQEQRSDRLYKYKVTENEIKSATDDLMAVWDGKSDKPGQVYDGLSETVQTAAKLNIRKRVENERNNAVLTTVVSSGLKWYTYIITTKHVRSIKAVVCGIGIKIPEKRWFLDIGEKHETREWGGAIAYYSHQDKCYYLFQGVSKLKETESNKTTYYKWNKDFTYNVAYPEAAGNNYKQLEAEYLEMKKNAKEKEVKNQRLKIRADMCERELTESQEQLEDEPAEDEGYMKNIGYYEAVRRESIRESQRVSKRPHDYLLEDSRNKVFFSRK